MTMLFRRSTPAWTRCLLASGLVLTVPASAQWTSVSLHPQGAISSRAGGTTQTRQVGYVEFFDTVTLQVTTHAALWSGSPAWTDLNPAIAVWSSANALVGTQQTGTALIPDASHAVHYHAVTWSGSAATWTDLHPGPAAFDSAAQGTTGSTHAGVVTWFGVQYQKAAVWIGGSCINLGPPGTARSEARAAGGGQQVGTVSIIVPGNQSPHAALWSGSAASWVDLHPPLSSLNHSIGSGLAGNQQVGYVVYEGTVEAHASIWAGTAASWVDVHPSAATGSALNATTGEFQAGYLEFGGTRHAAICAGAATGWVDLHSALPAGAYSSSEALAIARAGPTLYVAGYARDAALNSDRAMLWIGPAAGPCYPDCDQSGSLDVNDYVCFQGRFAAQNLYADCDHSGGPNVLDFVCFQAAFVAGCP